MNHKPFFYDVTLRDGNQALARPWNVDEKERVFRQLLKLGVHGIEVGFAGASDMDFAACEHLAQIAAAESPDTVIASLARAVKHDLERAAEAVKPAPKPRIHTFIALSPFAMENVLRMEPQVVKQKAVEAVAYAKSLLGERGSVQFSAEHFGDCVENLDFVIEVFHAVIAAGADTINLPNTVERYRPKIFVDMVEKVVQALPAHITVAVHTHNDLGMATATTVESFFVGAIQMECALNGMGERAGNTNFYEVAVALHNCGVETGLQLEHVYETALMISEMAELPIYSKAPLIGPESVAHRSGIHQDGASKTKGMKKGAYRPIDYSIIGRGENDLICFTSQSGRTAVFEILRNQGYEITLKEATELQPLLKTISEQEGELSEDRVLEIFKNLRVNVTEEMKFQSIHSEGDEGRFTFRYSIFGKAKEQVIQAEGPIEACLRLMHLEGHPVDLLEYKQGVVSDKDRFWAGRALSEIELKLGDKSVIGRGVHNDTLIANMKALFAAVNLLVHKD